MHHPFLPRSLRVSAYGRYRDAVVAAVLRAVLESQSQKKADLEEVALMETRRDYVCSTSDFRPSSRWPA